MKENLTVLDKTTKQIYQIQFKVLYIYLLSECYNEQKQQTYSLYLVYKVKESDVDRYSVYHECTFIFPDNYYLVTATDRKSR